jgi:hypothetical protein
MRFWNTALASFGLMMALLATGPGCQDCDTAGVAVKFSQGTTSADRTHYESSAVDGEWLHFPPGRRYLLRHNLRPGALTVQSYVAFPDDQDSGKSPSSYAESAGNQVVFETDKVPPQTIQVRNDTCAEFFVRVVADVAPTNGLESVGGNGGALNGGASNGGAQ